VNERYHMNLWWPCFTQALRKWWFVWRASHTLFVQTKIIWTCCHRGEDKNG